MSRKVLMLLSRGEWLPSMDLLDCDLPSTETHVHSARESDANLPVNRKLAARRKSFARAVSNKRCSIKKSYFAMFRKDSRFTARPDQYRYRSAGVELASPAPNAWMTWVLAHKHFVEVCLFLHVCVTVADWQIGSN
jgi:hypothetical protein